MLLIKCPQCNRSYRLAESLYRRKAAGYGVVITCRHCKTQIHVEESALPPPDADVIDASAMDIDEVTPPSRTEAQPVPVPLEAPESEPPPSSGQAMPLVVKPPVSAAAYTPEPEETQTLPQALPVHAPPNPPAPSTAAQNASTGRPAAAPRPAPSPPRPMGAATGTPLPVRPLTGGAVVLPRPMTSATATPMPLGGASGNASTTPLPLGGARPAAGATATPLPFRTAPNTAAAPRPIGSASATPLPVRPGGSTAGTPPRPPGGGAIGTPLPVRTGGSATGTPLPVRTGTQAMNGAGANKTPTPNDTVATPALAGAPPSADALVTPTPERTTAKLVALSPGLLGVSTALKDASISSPDADSAPNSGVPLSVPDAELFDIDSKPPDSAVPIDSVDYIESLPPPVAPVHHEPRRPAAADATKTAGKRLPAAPPQPPQPVRPPSPPLNDGDEPTRRFTRPGELSQDFLSADVGFERAPAIAPPDALALTRAPVSVRPPTTSARPGATATTRAPVSSRTASEPKSGGLGLLFVLVGAAFGAVGFFVMHRMKAPVEPEQARESATVATAATTEPAPAPLAVANATATSTATEAAPVAPETSAAAPVATEHAPALNPPTAASPPAAPPQAAAAAEKSPKSRGEKAVHESGSSSSAATNESTTKTKAEPAAATPAATATSTAAIEPRGPVGTEPFDVAAARSALEMSADQASNCRKEGDPSGVAIVTITFSQTGRVTTANISGPPFQATPTGGCIASTMRKTRVPPFAGDMVTVRKTVTIH